MWLLVVVEVESEIFSEGVSGVDRLNILPDFGLSIGT